MGDRPVAVETQYKEDPGGETMLAARWYGRQDVRVESVAKPALTEPKDAVVKVSFARCWSVAALNAFPLARSWTVFQEQIPRSSLYRTGPEAECWGGSVSSHTLVHVSSTRRLRALNRH